MTVKQIITKYLTDNGYDGLCDEETCCTCYIKSINHEDCCIHHDCKPGYEWICEGCFNYGYCNMGGYGGCIKPTKQPTKKGGE